MAQPKEYTATASVYIGQTTDANGNPMAGLNSNAKAAVQLLASQVVLKEAAERTGMDISASRLRKETTVETPSSTVKTTTSVVNIVVISVTDTDAERAAAAANALSEVLLERLESGVDEKIAVLEEQLAREPEGVRGGHGAQRRRAERRSPTSPTAAARPPRRPPPSAPYVALVQARRHRAGIPRHEHPADAAAAAHGQADGAAAHPARGGRPGLAERPAP